MSDKLQTIDEFLKFVENECISVEGASGAYEHFDTDKARAHLEKLMAAERLDELSRLDTSRHYGKDYQDSLDELDAYKDKRLAELQQRRKELEEK